MAGGGAAETFARHDGNAVFIQQGGNNKHEHIKESLELFSETVLPEFKARHDASSQHKTEELAPYVEAANQRIPPIEPISPNPPVDSYPVMMEKLGIPQDPAQRRSSILALLGAEPDPGDDD